MTLYPFLRRGLFMGNLTILALVSLGFVRFPLVDHDPLSYVGQAVIVVGLVCALGWVGMRHAQTTTSAEELALRGGVASGLVISALWIAYILGTHLLISDSEKQTLGGVLTNVTLISTLVMTLLASGYSGWRTCRIKSGLSTGLWQGFIAGLFSFGTTLVMLYVWMGFLVAHMNGGEIIAFAQSGWSNRETWFFWEEEFVGSAGYFAVHLVIGAVLGALGGLVGRLLAVLTRSRD